MPAVRRPPQGLGPYPWPLQPFDSQHPVRGFLCDPRIDPPSPPSGKSFHTGVDVVAPAGTPVYAVAAGKVSFGPEPDFTQNGGIVVVQAAGRNFGYWHVKPAVKPGASVAVHALLGHVAQTPEDWGHVHFNEDTIDPRLGISYWNPLRAGALTPFADFGPPVVSGLLTSRPSGRLSGLVDLSVKTFDITPIEVTQPQPPGWEGMPVTPASIRWQLVQKGQVVVPWHVAVDHRSSFRPVLQGIPASDVHFGDVYAPDTTQNRPHQPGLFHFWLKRSFDTRSHPDGDYDLEVEVSDVRNNTSAGTLAVTFANALSNP